MYVNLLFYFLFLSVCYADDATKCNGPNEMLGSVAPCPPEKTCKNRQIQFSCLPQQSYETKCICKKGFFRNAVGNCITEKDCDRCPGPHEYFACGSACDNVCSTLHKQNQTSCPIKNIRCNDKCYCEQEYARNDRNECVKIDDCNNDQCLGPNEEFTDCKRTCPPETCLSLVARFKCDSKQLCTQGCVCKPGFLRKEDGSPCMLLRQCPQLAGSPDF